MRKTNTIIYPTLKYSISIFCRAWRWTAPAPTAFEKISKKFTPDMAAVRRQFAEGTSWVGRHRGLDDSLIVIVLLAVAGVAALLTCACSCTHQFKDPLFFLSVFLFSLYWSIELQLSGYGVSLLFRESGIWCRAYFAFSFTEVSVKRNSHLNKKYLMKRVLIFI